MGLRDRVRGNDDPETQRFQMREKLMSFGDDFWIEDENGRRAYKVDGKAVRVRDTSAIATADGRLNMTSRGRDPEGGSRG